MKQSRIEKILLSLESGQIEIGWTTFLNAYSNLLRSIAFQFEANDSEAEDCYEYVCAKLSDDDFRRLRAFKPSGSARFRTWLITVAANLCKDWRRSRYGRQRAPSFVCDLSELEQRVFQLLYRQGMTHHECLHALRDQYPKLRPNDVERINGDLFEALSANQHWRLSICKNDPVPADDIDLTNDTIASRPDLKFQHDQNLERLETALSKLSPDQRLLLRLRYQQDLTLKEIARLGDFDDPYQARRAIEKALAALKKVFDL